MQKVIASGNFTMGRRVKNFESEFAKKFESNHAVMSNSGSSANLLAAAALRYSSHAPIASKNEVIVPAVSWSTTYYPFAQLGFTLRFVDVDLHTLNSRADQIEKAISANTAGIVVVNLLGNPSELIEIREMANSHNLFMVEDNCESLGARYQNKYAGSFGDIGTFSSFYSHHISTMEGGIGITKSEELDQIMRSLRAHGWTRDLPYENYVHNKSGDDFEDSFKFVLPGYNLRPLELEGAIGSEQLKKVDAITNGRRDNATKFKNLMSHYPDFIVQEETGESSWFGFSIILPKHLSGRRAEFLDILKMVGIQARPIVAGNFTRNPVLKHLKHVSPASLPNADRVHDDGLFLGNHHYPMKREFSMLNQAMSLFTGSRLN